MTSMIFLINFPQENQFIFNIKRVWKCAGKKDFFELWRYVKYFPGIKWDLIKILHMQIVQKSAVSKIRNVISTKIKFNKHEKN